MSAASVLLVAVVAVAAAGAVCGSALLVMLALRWRLHRWARRQRRNRQR